MTPEERQLLTALADRIEAAPAQQQDQEAAELLSRLVQQRPDTAYLLAQTVIMQDFALNKARAQIGDLQRQLEEARRQPPVQSSGSFLGGLFGGTATPPARPQYRAPGSASVPPVRTGPRAALPAGLSAAPAAPVFQPAQSSGFLQQAATTAVGIAGGALLFEGIQSLFGPHYYGGGFLGGSPWGGAGWSPGPSLTETTIVNNYYDDQPQNQGADDRFDGPSDPGPDQGGFQDAADDGSGQDFSDNGDFGGGNDDFA
jgi:hypothetical protein